MARYYNHCQRPFVSACQGASRITIVIYILTVFLSDTFSDSVFNARLSIQYNYLLLLLHIKIMMDLSWYPLRYAIGDPDVYCVFRPDFFHLTDSFVPSSESGTQSSCYHLWTEAEYRRHLKLSITASDRTASSGLHFVLATEFIKPVLHCSRTPWR